MNPRADDPRPCPTLRGLARAMGTAGVGVLLVACGGEPSHGGPSADTRASPATSAATVASAVVASSAPSTTALVPTASAAPEAGSGAPSVSTSSGSSSGAPASGVGTIAEMKEAARKRPNDFIGKKLSIDALYRRSTTRVHGGGEHVRYDFHVVVVADSKESEVTLACENTAPMPKDLVEHEPVTVTGRGMALAGTGTGYELYLASCTVEKR